jgi:phospholipid transport system substrate-binding protein
MIDRKNKILLHMLKPITVMLVFVVAATTAIAHAYENDDAKAVVERLHGALLSAMTQAATLGYTGRYELLVPVVAESFDFATIARIVTGRHWKELSDEQKNGFTSTFTELSTATYATNFDGFSGEHFETVGAEERRGSVIVKTILVKADGDEIELNYLLRERDGVWRIVNVIAEGVSDLSLKRADYTATIKNKGFDTLVNELNGKITAFASKTN